MKLQQDQEDHNRRKQWLEQEEQEQDQLQERCKVRLPVNALLEHAPALTLSALVQQGVHECERSDEEGEEEDEVGDGIMTEISAETTFIDAFNFFKDKLMNNLLVLENEAKSVWWDIAFSDCKNSLMSDWLP